jgi:hypothetical protein
MVALEDRHDEQVSAEDDQRVERSERDGAHCARREFDHGHSQDELGRDHRQLDNDELATTVRPTLPNHPALSRIGTGRSSPELCGFFFGVLLSSALKRSRGCR